MARKLALVFAVELIVFFSLTLFLVHELKKATASESGSIISMAVDPLEKKIIVLQTGFFLVVFFSSCAALLTAHRRLAMTRAQESMQDKAFQQSKEKYQTLFDNTDALVFTLDLEGRYMTMNQYGLNFLKTTIEEIRHKYVEEHLDEKSAAKFRVFFQEALRQGEISKTREGFFLGAKACFTDIFIKVLETGKNGDQILVIIRDVTDQKIAEDRFLQAEKMVSLGVLSAGIAHEINNPLSIIMGFCELLLEKTPEGSERYRNLSVIYDQSQQCKKVVENLLNFTRLSNIESGWSDVLVPLHAVIDIMRGLLRKKGIHLDLELPHRLPHIKIDDSAMHQIFLNLLTNAMDAMPAGGILKITAQLVTKAPRQGDAHGTLPASRRFVEIEIIDSGDGIPAEQMDKIFDPFFTTKPVGKGTGLGLSVTYGLTIKYGGTITCRSPVENGNEAHGTCFTIRFPVHEQDQNV